MTTSATAAVLASAIRSAAVQAGTETPAVRGADWQTATVTAIGADGTVTAGGIIARRLDTYVTPVIGDLVLLTNSGSGNWAALARMAPATTAGTWQTLSLAAGWTAWGSPYFAPAYRINGDGTASLSGLAKPPAATSGSTSLGTLPAAASPTTRCRFVTEVATGVFGALDIYSTGNIQITNYAGTAGWTALDVAHFRLS